MIALGARARGARPRGRRCRRGRAGEARRRAEGMAFAPAPEYHVFPTRERPLEALRGGRARDARHAPARRASCAPDAVVADILTLAPALAAELRGRAGARRSSPTSIRASAPGLPPYSLGARLPRTALGRALWRRARPRSTDAGLERGRRELNETRRRLGLPPLAHVHGGISQRAGARGDVPAARVPARRRAPRDARRRAAAVGAAGRRRRAAARRRAARARRAVDLAGPRAPPAARRARGPRRRCRCACSATWNRRPARRAGRRARATRGSSTGSPTRARCRAATSSSATAATARSRARWPAAARSSPCPAAGDMNENAARARLGRRRRAPAAAAVRAAPAAARGRARAGRRRACARARGSSPLGARATTAGAGGRARRGARGPRATEQCAERWPATLSVRHTN